MIGNAAPGARPCLPCRNWREPVETQMRPAVPEEEGGPVRASLSVLVSQFGTRSFSSVNQFTTNRTDVSGDSDGVTRPDGSVINTNVSPFG